MRVVLTDHNRAAPPVVELLGDRVVAIIDHHIDEGAHVHTVPGTDRVIDAVAGSSCSLVTEALARCIGSPPAELCALLLGTIALDTRGFCKSETAAAERRYAARDVRAVRWLLRELGAAEQEPEFPLEAAAATVEEAAACLREAPVPLVAGVGGASTVSALFQCLADARYEVGHLSVSDLLRLDYKDSKEGTVLVGAAAIFGTMSWLVEKEGGGVGLMGVVREFACQKGVDILFLMTRADETGTKGIAVLPTRATGSSAAMARILEAALTRVPQGLPEGLASQGLFQSQGVSSKGFGLNFVDVPGVEPAAGFRVSKMMKEITRKTMLPTILHFCGEVGPKEKL